MQTGMENRQGSDDGEASGGYMTNGRFENVPQTGQLDGPNREECSGKDAAWSQRSMYNAFLWSSGHLGRGAGIG